ncbi:hypothetical protein QZM22_27225 [Burkholderia oklahomensis]|uniref:hypothetical protein n=1 Tax=Burkholderia oklahomensis TaxID=342113 RepID=UPI00264C2A2A|nr:hypothetical protein [Burkholderia oklahomensis]MDN7676086.1 hypothetical protein [Burkholderia oklahomensis]
MKILNRLREPSTWAGLAGVAVALGADSKLHMTLNAMAGVLAAVAVLLPEKGDVK